MTKMFISIRCSKKERIRIRPASCFNDVALDKALQDEEVEKSKYLPGGYTRMTLEDGSRVPVIGDVKKNSGRAKLLLILCEL